MSLSRVSMLEFIVLIAIPDGELDAAGGKELTAAQKKRLKKKQKEKEGKVRLFSVHHLKYTLEPR